MFPRRVVGQQRIAIPDRGEIVPSVLPDMSWVSFDLEINTTSFAITPKFNPAIINPVVGRVRFRVVESGTSDPPIYGDWSAYFGPGSGNQPTGLQAKVTGLTTSILYDVYIRIEPQDFGLANILDYNLAFTITPVAGPIYLPVNP